MSDGKTHRLAGAGSGAVYAGYRAKQQQDHHWWAEVAGGALGGYVGGLLPDVLEPAISSWHRDVAHSCAVGGGVLAAMGNTLRAIEAACRENAEKSRAIPMEQQGDRFVPVADPITQLLSKLFELFWRLAAGFVNGVAAGYISHLALDAMTPRSIPLLTSGF